MSIVAFAIAVLSAALSLQEPAPREAGVEGILGIRVGMPLTDARARLAPLATMDARATHDGGTKEVWRFGKTGFAWIALRSTADGRVMWITGRRRPGEEIPFEELARARPSTDTGAIAIWYVTGGDGTVRVTARGRERRAQVITLIADGS